MMKNVKGSLRAVLLAVLITGAMLLFSACGGEEACVHDWGDEEILLDSGCDTSGTVQQVCAKCGEIRTEELSPYGHRVVAFEAVEPTCTEGGHGGGLHCNRCGEIIETFGTYEPLGHSFYTEAAVSATCEAPGKTERVYCTRCGEVKTEAEVIPAKGHTPERVEGYPATCTANGLTDGQRCAVCHLTLAERESIPMLEHDRVPVPGYEPTCTEDGKTDGVYCTSCYTMVVPQFPIAKLGHHRVDVAVVPATCEVPGLSAYSYCDRCGRDFDIASVIPAKGHLESSVAGYPATCEQSGRTDGAVCSVCNKVVDEGEEIPPLGHDLMTVFGFPATCTGDGKTDGQQCRRADCRSVFVAQTVIPARGHTLAVDTERSYAPTCKAMGCTYYKCTAMGCTFTDQRYIKELPHTEVIDPAVAPTLDATGLSEGKHCSVCGTVTAKQTVLKRLAVVTVVAGEGGRVEIGRFEGVAPGTELVLRAIPDEGYGVHCWGYEGKDVESRYYMESWTITVQDPDGVYQDFNRITVRFQKLEAVEITQSFDGPTIEGDRYYRVGEKGKLVATEPEGYLFVGWYEGSRLLTADTTLSFTMTSGGKRYTAVYKKAFRFGLINENPEGGTVSAGETDGATVYNGTRIYLTATPKEHYRFAGWYTESGLLYSTVPNCTCTMPSEDYTLYARFSPIKYGVTVGTSVPYAHAQVHGGGEFAVGAAVTVYTTHQEGLRFVGWYAGQTQVSTSLSYTFTMSAATVLLEARYEYIDYTVTRVTNFPSELVLENAVTTHHLSDVIYLDAPEYCEDGLYRFAGWYVDGVKFNGTYIPMPAEDITLVAHYVKRYEVTVSANQPVIDIYIDAKRGGAQAYAGDSVRVLTQFTDLNYRLIELRVNGELLEGNIFTMPEGDVTVTALVGKKRNVSVTKNYSSAPSVTAPFVAYEHTAVTAKAQSDATHRFVGWYEGDTLLSKDESYTFTMPERDLVLTARYAKIRYLDATGNYDDVPSISYPESVFEGDTATYRAESNATYRFAGWYLDGTLVSREAVYSFTMPTKDVTLEARYVKLRTVSVSVSDGAPAATYPTAAFEGDGTTVYAGASTDEYRFVGWYEGDALVSSELAYTFTMPTEDVALKAQYVKLYRVSASTDLAGAEATVSGVSFAPGEAATVCVQDYDGYRFIGWYVGDTLVSGERTYTLTVPEGGISLIGRYAEEFEVFVSANYPDNAVTVNGLGFVAGDTATVTATLYSQDYRFLGWYIDGALVSTSLSHTVTVTDRDIYAEARFERKHKLTLTLGNGATATGEGYYFEGDEVTVTLTSVPTAQSFRGWYEGGTLLTAERTYTFRMAAYDLELTAKLLNVWSGGIADGFAGGSGTVNQPFLIETAEQLARIAQGSTSNLKYHYKLINDIDLGNLNWIPIGGVRKIGSGGTLVTFGGSFDGNGHTIYNLRVPQGVSVSNAASYAGLFGYAKGAEIKNLTIDGYYVYGSGSSGNWVGTLVAKAEDTPIENCHVINGTVGGYVSYYDSSNTSYYFGMLVGETNRRVTSSHAEGDMEIVVAENGAALVTLYAGGLAGYLRTADTYDSYAIGSISIEDSNSIPGTMDYHLKALYAGGFAGYGIFLDELGNCYSDVDVSVYIRVKETAYVGGFAGYGTFDARYPSCSSLKTPYGYIVSYNNKDVVFDPLVAKRG